MQWWVVPMLVGMSAAVCSVFVYYNTMVALPMMVKAPTGSKVVCGSIIVYLMIAHIIAVGAVVGLIARFCRTTQSEFVGFDNGLLFTAYYLVPAFLWHQMIELAEERYFKKHPKIIVTEE